MIASRCGRRRRGAPEDRSLGCVLRPKGLATVRGAQGAPGPTHTRARGTKTEPTLYGASDVKRFSAEIAFGRTTAIVLDLAGRVYLAGRVLASSLGSIASCAGGTVALLAWSRRPNTPVAA